MKHKKKGVANMFFNKSHQYHIFLDGKSYAVFFQKGRKSKVCRELAKSVRLTFPNAKITAGMGFNGEVVIGVLKG